MPKAKNKIFRPAVLGNGGNSTFQKEFQQTEKGTDDVMKLMNSVPRNRERFQPSPVIMNDPYSSMLRAELPPRLPFNPSQSLKSSNSKFKASKPKW
jgi:hypothetical protein